MPIRHAKVSTVVDDADADSLSPTNWNADHKNTEDVTFHGAVGDGVTDDAAAITAAIAALPSAGGIVTFPVGIFAIASTISLVDKPNVGLVGKGAEHHIFQSGLTKGTILKWIGAAGGTMLSVGSSAALTTSTSGQRLEGIALDGQNSAAIGLLITSLFWGTFRDLHIRECTTVACDMTSVSMSGAEDVQGNVFEKISVRQITSASGKGIRLGSGADGIGNTSLNHFHDVQVYHRNGIGLELNDCDGNRFYGVWVQREAGGTGIGVELDGSNHASSGHARQNGFFFLQPGAGGVTARASGFSLPSTDNVVYGYSLGNSSALPTIEAGAGLQVHVTDGYLKGASLGVGAEAALSDSSSGIHVQDASRARVQVEGTGAAGVAEVEVHGRDGSSNLVRGRFAAEGSTAVVLRVSTTHALVIYTDNVERMRINSAGAIILGAGATGSQIRTGTGTPEGAVAAPVGSIYLRTDGGASTSFYVKESGAGNTGWVAK